MPQIAYRTVRSRRKFVNAPKVKRMLGDAIDAEVKPHYNTSQSLRRVSSSKLIALV